MLTLVLRYNFCIGQIRLSNTHRNNIDEQTEELLTWNKAQKSTGCGSIFGGKVKRKVQVSSFCCLTEPM